MAKLERLPEVKGILHLEHFNFEGADHDLATKFFINGLGLTRDPYRRTDETNMGINIGTQQFHLPRRGQPTPPFFGEIGIIVPDVENIKKNLSKISSTDVSLNIKEVKKPELNAFLVAENIAQQLVKRIAFRKAMKRAMQSALRLGAKGIRVCLAGRLAGNEIARTEWLREGSVPLHTFRADVDYAEAEALTTYGIIGVKVWIYKGEIFSKSNKINNNKGKENATTSKNKV